jgi:hypothetical protein
MKHLIIAIVTLASVAAYAQIGSDAIAIQRARNVANQNNNRSMDPEAHTGAPMTPTPAPATPAATPMNAAQQAYAHFQSSFLGLNSNSTPVAKQQFESNLSSVAQGANKPSAGSVSKLSEHLAAAVSESKLTSTKKTRVAQEVAVLLNTGNTDLSQRQAMIKDVQSTLESGGASSENAAAVAADLETVSGEVLKTAAK